MAAILSVIAAVRVVLTIKQFTGKFHSKTQWIRAIATFAAAILIVISLFTSRHLDQIRTTREQAQVTDLIQTKQALEALRLRTQPRQLSAAQGQ
jgi:hypothetical protein